MIINMNKNDKNKIIFKQDFKPILESFKTLKIFPILNNVS